MPDGLFSGPLPEAADDQDITTPDTNSRDVSTIAFPYASLKDALGIAQTILDKGGSPMSRNQIAGAMGMRGETGSFAVRLSAARMFGLIEAAFGKYHLTDLGLDAISLDEARAKVALIHAFLNVPLYRRVYDEFRQRRLPPRPYGLEEELLKFGVAPKQTGKARRAFDHSARLAGFFEHGHDRLVEPGIVPPRDRPQARQEQDHPNDPAKSIGHNDSSIASKDSDLIKGLFNALPPHVGDEWSYVDRLKWLTLAAHCFDMIYGQGQLKSGAIKVSLTFGRGKKSE